MTNCQVCDKTSRAVLYCRRADCPSAAVRADRRSMSSVLPPPEVAVSHTEGGGDHQIDVVISRPGTGNGRAYRGQGTSTAGAVKQVIDNIFKDPGSREYHGS